MTRTAGLETAAALLVGVVLIVLGATFADPGSSQPDLRASTYVNDPRGLRALHEVLRSCGLRPERLVEPPAALGSTDRTLVVAAPSEPFTDAQLDTLFEWVADGGRLVVVAAVSAPPLSASFHGPLLERAGLRARRRFVAAPAVSVRPDAGIDTDVRIEAPTSQVLDVVPDAPGRDPRAGEARALIESRAHVAAVVVPFGPQDGEIVALGDDSMLVNDHLGDADNAVVAVQLLTARARDEGRVVFDEYHHGFRPDGTREGLWSQSVALLWTTWPGRGVVVLFAAWLVLLAGRGVRLGAPLPDAPAPRRRLSEHADALGMLLEKSRSRAEALRVLAAGARRAVAARSGLPQSLPPGVFRDRLAASPAPGAAELAEALDEAGRLLPARDGDVARVARRLARARHHYLHGEVHRGT